MNKNEIKIALYDMLYLTACAVNDTSPTPEKLRKMDLPKVFAVSRRHSLEAMTCYAVESAGLPQDDTLKKWAESKNKAIRKNMLLDAERARISAFLESRGIRHMPLKGVLLKDMYPKIGMRQMSDNDILYDGKFHDEVRGWFIENGYTAEDDGASYHDSYQKKPVYNYELHTVLVSKFSDFFDYYANVDDRLIPDSEGAYASHFSDEDFYIYMIVHMYKHFTECGTGLRSLLDICVFMRAKGGSLDMKYVGAELEKLGISRFEQQCRALSDKIFSSPESMSLTDEERELLEYFLSSGTYGTPDNRIINRMKRIEQKSGSSSGLKYLLSRIFPDMEHIRKHFPFFYRHKILLPFCWIYRIFRALTVRRKKLAGELKGLRKINRGD